MTRKASPREIQETLGDLRFAMHSLNRADGPESSAVTRNRSARDGPERLARHQLSFNTQACTADRRRWSGDPCRLGLPSVVLGTPGVWWVNHWAWAPVEAPAERRATRTNSLRRCILTPPSVGVAAFYNARQVFNFVKSASDGRDFASCSNLRHALRFCARAPRSNGFAIGGGWTFAFLRSLFR
jgi:hypothetical protein